jgi:O-antigen/teichoic acid export membrane protein
MKQSNWIFSVGASVAIGVLSVVPGILLARFLGVEGRGIFAESMIYPNLIIALFGVINIQTISFYWNRLDNPMERRRFLGTALSCALCISVLASACAVAVNLVVLGSYRMSLSLANVYSLSLPVTLVGGIATGVFLGEQRFRLYWGYRFLYTGLYLSGLTLLVIIQFDINPMRFMLVLVTATIVSGGLALVYLLVIYRPQFCWEFPYLRDSLTFGIKTNMAGLPYQINSRLDQIMISNMLSVHILGLYVVAFAWASQLVIVSSGVATVMIPYSATVHPGNSNQVANLQRQYRGVSIALSAVSLGAMAVAPFFVPFLFGSNFRAAVVPSIILCAAMLFLSLNHVLHEIARGLGFPGLSVKVEFFGCALNACLMIILLRLFGIIGAAISALVSYFVIWIILQRVLSNKLLIGHYGWCKWRVSDFVLVYEHLKKWFTMRKLAVFGSVL